MPKLIIQDEKRDYNLKESFYDKEGNLYKSHESLELWTRMSSNGATDLSENEFSVSKASTPSFNQRSVAGLKNYYTLNQLDDDGFLRVTSTAAASNRLENKITFSAWLYLGPMTKSFGRIFMAGNFDIELYRVKIAAGDERIALQVKDTSGNSAEWMTGTIIPNSNWSHVAFSIDLTNLASGPKFYINAKKQPVDENVTPTPPFTGIGINLLYIGWQTTYAAEAEIAEACVWSSVLSNEEIKAVYNSSVRSTFSAEIASGMLTNPVRTIIRENDHRTGSYPTNARTGDPDFTGKNPSFFDDGKAVDFFSGRDEAIIKISGNKDTLSGLILGLTSSNGSYKKDFELSLESSSSPGSYSSFLTTSSVLKIKYDSESINPVTGFKNGSSGDISRIIANAINSEESLGITAEVRNPPSENFQSANPNIPNEIVLKHLRGQDSSTQITMVRKYNQGSTVLTLSEADLRASGYVKVTPFISQHKIINAGTRLTDQSPNERTNLSSPNRKPDLDITKGPILRGVSDYGIHFTPGEDLSPFDESRIDFKETEFYLSGSERRFFPNISQKLRDKTQIKINLRSSDSDGDPIFFATGSTFVTDDFEYGNSGAGGTGLYHPQLLGKFGTGFAYWNFRSKKWLMSVGPRFLDGLWGEFYSPAPIRDSYWGEPINPRSLLTYDIGYLRGFTKPSYLNEDVNPKFWYPTSNNTHAEVLEKTKRIQGVGHPTTTCLFPEGVQYEADEDHVVRMKDYISSPFVVEKMTIKVRGKFGISSLSDEGIISFRNFFILRQSNSYPSGSLNHLLDLSVPSDFTRWISSDYYDLSSELPRKGLLRYRTISPLKDYGEVGARWSEGTNYNKGSREVLSYARIGICDTNNRYKTTLTDSEYLDFKSSFDQLIEYETTDQTLRGITSSFSMELTPRRKLKNSVDATPRDVESIFRLTNLWEVDPPPSPAMEEYDSRDQVYAIDFQDGQPAHSPGGRFLKGASVVSEYRTDVTGSFEYGDILIKPKKKYFEESPYVLNPEDSLVFGWENIPDILGTNVDQLNADEIVDFLNNIEITFHGCHLRNETEYHENGNQPLNSDAIHEVIQGSPIVDQYEVSSQTELFRSSNDRIVFGSIYYDSLGVGVRGTLSYSLHDKPPTSVQVGVTRNTQISSGDLVYYDSVPPLPGSFIKSVIPTVITSRETIPSAGGISRPGLYLDSTTTTGERFLNHLGITADKEIEAKRSLPLPPNPFQADGTGDTIKGTYNLDYLMLNSKSTDSEKYIFSGSESRVYGAGGQKNSNYWYYFREISSISQTTFWDRATSPRKITSFAPYSVGVPSSVNDRVTSDLAKFTRSLSDSDILSMNKIIFGIPKVVDKSTGERGFPVKKAKSRNWSSFAYEYPHTQGTSGVGAILEDSSGFRYGLMSASPIQPTYHFRRSSYGQFRDILYSPPEGKYMLNPDSSTNYPLDSEVTSFTLSIAESVSPIRVTFVGRDGSLEDPLNTNSSNLSIYATSSFPYFETFDNDSNVRRDRNTVNYPYPEDDQIIVG